MPLAQKISVSLDPSLLSFIDRYASDHGAKGRSAVVARALQLLQRSEEESYLSAAYAQSAEQDLQMAAEFNATLTDGLETGAPSLKAAHEAW